MGTLERVRVRSPALVVGPQRVLVHAGHKRGVEALPPGSGESAEALDLFEPEIVRDDPRRVRQRLIPVAAVELLRGDVRQYAIRQDENVRPFGFVHQHAIVDFDGRGT